MPGSTSAIGMGWNGGAYFPESSGWTAILPRPSLAAAQFASQSWPSALTAPMPVTTVRLRSAMRFGFCGLDQRYDAVEKVAQRFHVGELVHLEDDAIFLFDGVADADINDGVQPKFVHRRGSDEVLFPDDGL